MCWQLTVRHVILPLAGVHFIHVSPNHHTAAAFLVALPLALVAVSRRILHGAVAVALVIDPIAIIRLNAAQ